MQKIILLLLFVLSLTSNCFSEDLTLMNFKEAQVIPSSPNVAPMMQYIDKPISYFNGTTSVSIPLGDIQIYDIKLPLSLSYSSTGCRPSEEASWVGLGWSFSLNSSISRVVKCVDDFLEYRNSNYGCYEAGYYDVQGDIKPSRKQEFFRDYYYNPFPYSPAWALTAINRGQIQIRDSEPDIFSFSTFSGGGKFLLTRDRNDEALFMNKPGGWKAVIIEGESDNQAYLGETHCFTLIAEDGTRYEFGKREIVTAWSGSGQCSTSDLQVAHSTTSSGNAFSKYASSWFLTKIISPKGAVVDFEYEKVYYYAPAQSSCTKYNCNNYQWGQSDTSMSEYYEGDCEDLTKQQSYSWHNAHYNTYRLSRIRWKGGDIELKTSSREDMATCVNNMYSNSPCQKLDQIIVHDGAGNTTKQYKLHYGYFNAEASGYTAFLFKRLRLDSIQNQLDPQEIYKFGYIDGNLPSKGSTSVDYWGYYNGRNYGGHFYNLAYDTKIQKARKGALRYSDEPSTKIGMLSSVIYPTGGEEKFEYELNEFRWKGNMHQPDQIIRSESFAVSNIANVPDSEKSKRVEMTLDKGSEIYIYGEAYAHNGTFGNYDYNKSLFSIYHNDDLVLSRPILRGHIYDRSFDIPEFSYRVPESGTYTFVADTVCAGWCVTWYIEHRERQSREEFECDTIPMRGAGLRLASIEGGGRKRELTYSMGTLLVDPVLSINKRLWGYFAIYFGIEGEDSKDNFIAECKAGDFFMQVSESLNPLSSFANGYIVGYPVVKERTGDIIKEYEYRVRKEMRMSSNPYVISKPEFGNGSLLRTRIYDGTNQYEGQDYTWSSKQSSHIQAFTFNQGIPTTDYSVLYNVEWPYINRLTSFRYGEDGTSNSVTMSYEYTDRLDLRAINQTVGGHTYTNKVIFSYESSDTICQKMKSRNMTLPVEELALYDGRIISSKKIDYAQFDSLILPKSVSVLDTKINRYVEKVRYTKYNKYGNLEEVYRDGMPTTYLWGYKGHYPIVEAVNCTYNAVKGVMGMDPSSILDKTVPSVLDSVKIERLIDRCAESQITILSYKPQIGISDLKTSVGKRVYFRYDPSGRLKMQSFDPDFMTHIIESYKYKYSGTNK